MASEPQPGSTHGTTTRTPPPTTVAATTRTSYVQNCVVLLDWWLERVEGQDRKIRVVGYTTRNQDAVGRSSNRKQAARLFTSDCITARHSDGTIDTADEKIVLIRGPLNISQMHQNGFPDEVSKCFKLGFPVQWEKYIYSNMEQKNERTQSPSKSTEYFIQKFLNGSFINSMGYTSTGNDFNISGFTGNTDGPSIGSHSNLSYGTPRYQKSTGDNANLFTVRMDMPEETLTEPTEPCNRGQAINQRDVHRDSSKVTHSVETTPVNNHTDNIFSDLAGFQTPKRGQTLVHPGTGDTFDVSIKERTPKFGAVQSSEDSTIRRLRNGKVFGMSNGDSLKKGHSKRKAIQHETFNCKVVSSEELTLSADLPSHENGGSVAPIITEGTLQSHDSNHQGKGTPGKRARRTVQ